MELTRSTVEGKTHQAHQLVDDVARQAAERAAPAIERAAQVAHSTVDRVAGAAAPAAEWMQQGAEQLKQQQDALLATARGYVRERPLVVLGIALATGFLVGRLAR